MADKAEKEIDVRSSFRKYLQKAPKGSSGAPSPLVSAQNNSEGKRDVEGGGCVVESRGGGQGGRRRGMSLMCRVPHARYMASMSLYFFTRIKRGVGLNSPLLGSNILGF